MTASIVLPTPTFVAPGRSYDGKPSRSRKVNFPVEGTEDKFVQVSVLHLKERKEFLASAQQVTIKKEAYGTCTSFWLFKGVTLQRRPVARYSEKALEAFLTEVMGVFPDLVESSDKLQQMFTVLEEGP